VSIDRSRLIIGIAFERWGILLKNEFLEALFIDKVCFILFALPSWVDPEKKAMKLMMLKLVDGFFSDLGIECQRYRIGT